MAYNHDGKYEHFTAKTFKPEGRSGSDTTKGEASPCAPEIDWKEMKGLQKPWEAKYDESEGSEKEERSESKKERKAEGD